MYAAGGRETRTKRKMKQARPDDSRLTLPRRRQENGANAAHAISWRRRASLR